MEGLDLSFFTQERYDTIVEYKTSYYSFYLPVVLAMLMSDRNSPAELARAKEILLRIGYYFQVKDIMYKMIIGHLLSCHTLRFILLSYNNAYNVFHSFYIVLCTVHCTSSDMVDIYMELLDCLWRLIGTETVSVCSSSISRLRIVHSACMML